MIIAGKHIKDYVSLPYGAFGRLVRERVDPLWGLDESQMCFEVTISYMPRAYREDWIGKIAAPDEDTARKLAMKAARDGTDGDDYQIESVEEQGA